jgi:hypothetical protein
MMKSLCSGLLFAILAPGDPLNGPEPKLSARPRLQSGLLPESCLLLAVPIFNFYFLLSLSHAAQGKVSGNSFGR